MSPSTKCPRVPDLRPHTPSRLGAPFAPFPGVNHNSSGGRAMIRRILASIVVSACAGVAFAAQPVTFVLRNGERVSGELTYKGGTTYTLNGTDYPSDNI